MGRDWRRPVLMAYLPVVVWVAGGVQLLPAQETLATQKAHEGEVRSLVFSQDGKWLFSGGTDGTARLWEVATGKLVKSFPGHKRIVCAVALSPDGKTLAAGAADPGLRQSKVTIVPFKIETIRETPTDAEIKIWDLAEGTEKAVFKVSAHLPLPLAFSKDGKSLISGGGPAVTPGGTGQAVKTWDLHTRQETASHKGPPGEENWVAFTSDGKCLAWGCENGEVKFRNLNSGKEWSGRHPNPVVSVVFSPDGKLLAAADTNVKLWEANTGRELAVLPGHRPGRAGVFALAFTADGQRLASGGGLGDPGQEPTRGVIRIWEVQTRKLVTEIQGHNGRVTCLAFIPNGTILASGSADGTIKLWRRRSAGEEKGDAARIDDQPPGE